MSFSFYCFILMHGLFKNSYFGYTIVSKSASFVLLHLNYFDSSTIIMKLVKNLGFRLKGDKMCQYWLHLNLNWPLFIIKSIKIDKFMLNGVEMRLNWILLY